MSVNHPTNLHPSFLNKHQGQFQKRESHVPSRFAHTAPQQLFHNVKHVHSNIQSETQSTHMPSFLMHKEVSQSKGSVNNVHELSQDLSKLKEQLRKLAQKGQGFSNKKQKEEQDTSIVQNRSNISSDTMKRRQTSQEAYRPQTNHIHVPNFLHRVDNHNNTHTFSFQQSQNRRQKTESFTNQRSKGVVPIVNPNKKEHQRMNEVFQVEKHVKIELKLQVQIKQLKQKNATLVNQLEIAKLQKQNLRIELAGQKKMQDQLRDQLKSAKKQHQQRLKDLKQNTAAQQLHQKQQLKYNFNIQKLQNQIAQMKSLEIHSFNDALKGQLQENKLLRQKLEEKNQEISQLKDSLAESKKCCDSYKNQLKVQQMRLTAQMKSLQQKLQIQLNDRSNDLQTAKRALQTLDLKYKLSMNEIKQKDEFIMNYFVSRSQQNDKQEIQVLLNQYKKVFPENRTVQDLLKEQRKIEQLTKQLQYYKINQK